MVEETRYSVYCERGNSSSGDQPHDHGKEGGRASALPAQSLQGSDAHLEDTVNLMLHGGYARRILCARGRD